MGLKRTVASSRQQSGGSLDKGRQATTFEVYKRMCEIVYKSEDDDFCLHIPFSPWNGTY